MAKPELEFFDPEYLPWVQVEGQQPGQCEKILSLDPETSDCTRLKRSLPGTVTTQTYVHDWWEEVYVLKGELHDLLNDKIYGEGSYCCRPPGMKHGPFEIPRGVVCLEIHYGKKPIEK
ncbi:MAG: hypothetical protein HKM93_17430 [Desulfobacteraceae bacterium]|nr:hypothetical protein [Desulfobacteraceae bacterium]